MKVTTSKLQNNFGYYLKCAKEEDVIITKNNTPVAVLSSIKETVGVGETLEYYHTVPKMNYEEFEKIDDGNRYELIDGHLYLLASPRVLHQYISIELSGILRTFFKGKTCQPFTAPFDVHLYKDEIHNVVQPDLIVICDKEHINEKNSYEGTPSLVIEILSPSTRSKDMILKLDLYSLSGVEEYWIIDPKSSAVIVYRFEDSQVSEIKAFHKGDLIESIKYPGLTVLLDTLFEY